MRLTTNFMTVCPDCRSIFTVATTGLNDCSMVACPRCGSAEKWSIVKHGGIATANDEDPPAEGELA